MAHEVSNRASCLEVHVKFFVTQKHYLRCCAVTLNLIVHSVVIKRDQWMIYVYFQHISLLVMENWPCIIKLHLCGTRYQQNLNV